MAGEVFPCNLCDNPDAVDAIVLEINEAGHLFRESSTEKHRQALESVRAMLDEALSTRESAAATVFKIEEPVTEAVIKARRSMAIELLIDSGYLETALLHCYAPGSVPAKCLKRQRLELLREDILKITTDNP